MSQSYDVGISRRGGFSSVSDALAHRKVVGQLTELVKTAEQTAAELKRADLVDIQSTDSVPNKDLAPGKGQVVMLSQTEQGVPYGAELNYAADGSTRSLVLDLPEKKLTQMGSSFKLEQGGVTTYFKHDTARGVLNIMDAEADVPRIFGDADPQKLTAGTIQTNTPIFIF